MKLAHWAVKLAHRAGAGLDRVRSRKVSVSPPVQPSSPRPLLEPRIAQCRLTARPQIGAPHTSAHGSYSSLRWALQVLPGSPEISVLCCACVSQNFLLGSVVEASDVVCSMLCVCVDHVMMWLRGHRNTSRVASYGVMVPPGRDWESS